MLRVVKEKVGALQDTIPLHVDPVGAVDQDVGNSAVGKQRFYWTETEKLIDDFFDQLLAFAESERRSLPVK